jgi:Protein of unknwon function (DUF3310)
VNDYNKDYFRARNAALEKLIGGVNHQQIGGGHYKLKTFQHWDFVIANGLGYFEGQITKYLCRWREKNGVQDLEKAMHYLAKLISASREGKQRLPSDSRYANKLTELSTSYPSMGLDEMAIIRILCVYVTEQELSKSFSMLEGILQDAKNALSQHNPKA